jgi:hypothetical protein
MLEDNTNILDQETKTFFGGGKERDASRTVMPAVGAACGTPVRLAGGPSRPLERQGLDRALDCACAVQTWNFRRNVHPHLSPYTYPRDPASEACT